MEELKSQVAALEKNASQLGQFLSRYYKNQEQMTHGMWEDKLKLAELQAKVLDLKLKLAELEQR